MLAAGNLLGKTCNLIIGDNLAAHINRLGQHHRRHGHIPRVGTQSVYQPRTDGVEPAGKRTEMLAQRGILLHHTLQLLPGLCAEMAQRILLLVADERQLV